MAAAAAAGEVATGLRMAATPTLVVEVQAAAEQAIGRRQEAVALAMLLDPQAELATEVLEATVAVVVVQVTAEVRPLALARPHRGEYP